MMSPLKEIGLAHFSSAAVVSSYMSESDSQQNFERSSKFLIIDYRYSSQLVYCALQALVYWQMGCLQSNLSLSIRLSKHSLHNVITTYSRQVMHKR